MELCDVIKKGSIVIGIIVSLFLTSYITGIVTERKLEQTITEYRNTANKFEEQLGAERERNIKLTEINKSIESKLDSNIARSTRAEETIIRIGTGLSKDVEDLEGIIRAIRQIRIAIEEYERES